MKRNKLLQQIGMPFISTIFMRSPSAGGSRNDPFAYLNRPKKTQDNVEQLPLNTSNKNSITASMFIEKFRQNNFDMPVFLPRFYRNRILFG